MARKSIFILAACLLLAPQNSQTAQFNTQGITPPPGSHATNGRSQAALESTGGAGLLT